MATIQAMESRILIVMSILDAQSRIDSREALGRIVRAERKRRKIDQRTLAASAGVALGSLYHLERGDAPVTTDTLLRITQALAMDLHLVPRPRTEVLGLL
jgi:DNA-binding XRE family transcriptional regulator